MKKIIVFLILSGFVLSQTFKNIRVDKFAYSPNEVTISINPSNPQIIAAGSNYTYFYRSLDGGMSWEEYPVESEYGAAGDPVVLFDGNNNLYYSHLKNGITSIEPYSYDRIVIRKSSDYGKYWKHEGFTTPNGPKFQDKEWLAVDLSNNSPYKDNLYITWTEFDEYGVSFNDKKSRILFSYSEDQGKTWAISQKISDLEGNCEDGDLTTEGAVPATGPDGEVYISWGYNSKIYFDKSLDGGKTFGTDIIVADQPGGWEIDIPGLYRCNGMPVTKCDISDSDYRGRIYVNWADQRNGSDNVDIFVAWSDDKGETWSEPKRVNDDDSERHQFFTWMTVDPTDGNIYIVFYDRRETQSRFTDVYLACSKDGGSTFKNVKISESSFSPSEETFFGDYLNIDAYNGNIHPIWTRMNITLSIWTTAITKEMLWPNTSVENEQKIIESFQLYQNYPNPFNPATVIKYELPEGGFTTIKIYDPTGKEIKTLVQEYKSPGTHKAYFDGSDMASGIYIYKMFCGDYQDVKKMVLMK